MQKVGIKHAIASCCEIFLTIRTVKNYFSANVININAGHIAMRARARISQCNSLYED